MSQIVATYFESNLIDAALAFIIRELKFSSFLLLVIIENNRRNDQRRDKNSILPSFNIDLAKLLTSINDKSFAIIGPVNQEQFNYLKYSKAEKANEIILYFDYASRKEHNVSKFVQDWKFLPVWSSRALILVILANAPEPLLAAQDVAEQLWARSRAGNVIFIGGSKNEISFYSWTPYEPHCSVRVHRISTYQEYQQNTSKKLIRYPNYKNLNRCKLVAAAAVMAPFVDEPDSTGYFGKGLEVKIFQTLASMLNFTFSYVTSKKGESAFVTYVNGTPVGLHAKLVWNEADILFHGLRIIFHRTEYSEVIDSHYPHSFVWAAPLPEKVPEWKSIYVMFDTAIWLLIVIVFMAASWLLNVLRHSGKDGGNSALVSLLLTINTPGPCPTKGGYLRLYLCCHFFFALNVSAAYQSGLFKIMTEGLTIDPMETIEELVQANYQVTAYPSGFLEVQAGAPALYKEMENKHLMFRSEDPVFMLRIVAYQNHSVSLVSDAIVSYETNNRFLSKHRRPYIRVLKHRFMPFAPAFYLPTGHPIKPVVQVIMRRLIEHGWVRKFLEEIMEDAARSGTFSESELLDKFNDYYAPGTQRLTTEQLTGGFLISISSLVFSLIVFILELIFHKFDVKEKLDVLIKGILL